MIIDTEANLTRNFKRVISETGVERYRKDYHIVSIIGSQSSGKSTFLNKVFGTRFRVMDENSGRVQTTKGIQCGMAVSSPIFLIDPEGSDSKERGDAAGLFERKSALFSIALSEVIIVNLWETDIGRYKAANIPMLQAAFEANAQLFTKYKETTTNIVFVIRDLSTTHKEALFKQLLNDMKLIWKEIQLPDNLKDTEITDFFNIQFETMRHMKLDYEGFREDAKRIREKFSSNVFWPKNSTKIVPAGSLAKYIERLWKIINENKELNIPSQRELISISKCTDAVQIAFETFKEKIVTRIDSKSSMELCIKKAFKVYQKETWKYMENVVSKYERMLRDFIQSFISPLLKSKANAICESHIAEFRNKTVMNEIVLEEKGKWGRLSRKRIHHRLNICTTEINEMVPDGIKWSYDLSGFSETVNSIIMESKASVTEGTISYLTDEILEDFGKKLGQIYRIPDNKTGEKVSDLIEEYVEILQEKVNKIFTANDVAVPTVEPTEFIEYAETLARENARFIVLKMKTVFDSSFLYVKNRIPRVWRKGDDINGIYERCRKDGLEVLNDFTEIIIGGENKVLIKQDKVKMCIDTYERIITNEYKHAYEILQKNSGASTIPPWATSLCLLLSFDWILWGLKNPIVMIIAFIALILYIFKRTFLLGPVLQVVSNFLDSKKNQRN